jgi:cellulose synthase/poly-beta-1,6-N-acetylglucosamine synthase-like glycosyltransferase
LCHRRKVRDVLLAAGVDAYVRVEVPMSVDGTPKITVVVPTYNERENLPTLVGLLGELQLPNLHVLVVDDDSPDGTSRSACCTGPRRTVSAGPTWPA